MVFGNCRREAVTHFEDAVAPSRSGITALTTQREQAQVMQLPPSAQAPSVYVCSAAICGLSPNGLTKLFFAVVLKRHPRQPTWSTYWAVPLLTQEQSTEAPC